MKLYRSKSRICLTVLVATLAACGGGGDGSSTSTGTPTSTTLTVTGTAATGLSIPGATVNGKCKVGTGTATTLTNGTFTLTVTDGQLPCVLQITNPADGTKLHTLVLGTGNSAVANITPLTEMTTARVLGSEPNVFFAAFDAVAATQKVTTTSVATAQTAIDLVFTGTIDTTAIGDFMTTPLIAATQDSPTSGDAQDKLLDALKLKLTTAQIGTVTTALASNQTTDAIKQTIVSMTTAPTTPPVANAGATQSVVAGTTVTLDASTSSAAAGKSLTYAWTLISKPAGSSATLASPNTAKPTFVADAAGSYVVTVIVNDGTTDSSAASVTVTASVANAAPVANAGVAQNVVSGALVTLNGSTSSDANGDSLTYAWTLTSKPSGSVAALTSATSAMPTFTADVAGTYVASLIVNDGKLNSTATTVTVTAAVANVAPVANAGVAQNVVAGTVVTLDGSASSDANGDPLTYAWTLTSKPAGSTAALSSATSAKPTFTADVTGTYVASLTVNDGKVSSNTATVSISTANPVSGLLSSSTTWTKANSPYVMTGNVMIPGGVTLSIPAGVEVRGSSFQIQTEGTLNISGISSDPVTLKNVVITPAGKLASNHFISIVGATITGGSVYAASGNAIYGSLVLTDSRISDTSNGSYLYLWYPLGTNVIERNIFTNAGGISYGVDARGAAVSLSVKNNKFIAWTGGFAIQNWAMYGANVATVQLNSFLSTDRVAVRLPTGYTSTVLDAANNYWGTTSSSVIASMIFDKNDDLNSGNTVNYTPILTVPDIGTPQ
ncbi:MAG: PKD domain-containing protein [Rhodoferax sp.]|uniref:beta strand repeat-containing protein n=1 Tax=Rhodoferax sp. TaxID=50421 RepID=UPI003C755E06